MGYSIHYGPTPKIVKKQRKFPFGPAAAALLLIISLITASRVWPDEAAALQEALFPWTQEPVKAAFSDFVKDLNAGDSFRDAAAAFCREILDDAQQIP